MHNLIDFVCKFMDFLHHLFNLPVSLSNRDTTHRRRKVKMLSATIMKIKKIACGILLPSPQQTPEEP